LKNARFSRLIAGGSILLGFVLAGNGLRRWCSIPLPSAVIGLTLLAAVVAASQRLSALKSA
jgi:putative effector of murein hydrolase LrgA (UPF0299 family)